MVNPTTMAIPLTVGDAETPVSRLATSVVFSHREITSGNAYWGGRLVSGQPVLNLERLPA